MINTKLFLTHRAKIQPKFNMFPNYWWNFQTIAPCKVINQFKIDSFGLFEINLFFSRQPSNYTVKPILQRSLHSTFLRQCGRLSIENNVYFGPGPPNRGHHARPLYRCTTTVPVSSFLHLCHMSPQLCRRRICENLSQNIEKTASYGALNFAVFDDVGTFRSGKKRKLLSAKSLIHMVYRDVYLFIQMPPLSSPYLLPLCWTETQNSTDCVIEQNRVWRRCYFSKVAKEGGKLGQNGPNKHTFTNWGKSRELLICHRGQFCLQFERVKKFCVRASRNSLWCDVVTNKAMIHEDFKF